MVFEVVVWLFFLATNSFLQKKDTKMHYFLQVTFGFVWVLTAIN